MALILDRREQKLGSALEGSIHFEMKDLPVGDVLCGSSWIAERKTVSDLASSIRKGRWAEQTARLIESGCRRIIFIIEGDMREDAVGIPYNALWSACLTAELRNRCHVIRTWDIDETAALVRLLVQKGECPAGGAPRLQRH